MCQDCERLNPYERFMNQVSSFERALLKGKNDFESIASSIDKQELNLLDTIFRPDNEKRQREIQELSVEGYSLCSSLLKKINKIKTIDHKTFDHIKKARLTGENLGGFAFAVNSIQVISTIASGLIDICALLAGEAPITWPLLVLFAPVVGIMKGMEVHERYTEFEELLNKLRPAIRKLKDVER